MSYTEFYQIVEDIMIFKLKKLCSDRKNDSTYGILMQISRCDKTLSKSALKSRCTNLFDPGNRHDSAGHVRERAKIIKSVQSIYGPFNKTIRLSHPIA